MNLTVIVPTLNEERSLPVCLSAIRREFSGEIFVVDGGSHDATVDRALESNTRVWHAPQGLARQCNFGVEKARGDIIWLVSADCRPLPGWYSALQAATTSEHVVGGGFRLSIDDPFPLFSIIAFGGNFRSQYLKIALGDQGLFVRRSAYERVGGMHPESRIPFARLCFDLHREGEFRLLSEVMVSSSRKWRERGILKTTLRHMWTYLQFKRTELLK